jgi:hypothetical protein
MQPQSCGKRAGDASKSDGRPAHHGLRVDNPANMTARALMAAWKDVDPSTAAVAEVIMSAFASGMA